MRASLDWLGCATFRLTLDDLVVFLDAYVDRVPAAPPVGLSVADVVRADAVLVGHSHLDHLWGAERITVQRAHASWDRTRPCGWCATPVSLRSAAWP